MMEWSRPFTSKFPFSSNSIFFPFMVVLQRGRRHYILHAMLRFMSDALPAAVAAAVVCILAMTKFAFYGISHIACMQYTYPSCYTPPICWGLYTIWQEISKISWQLSQRLEYKNSYIGSINLWRSRPSQMSGVLGQKLASSPDFDFDNFLFTLKCKYVFRRLRETHANG